MNESRRDVEARVVEANQRDFSRMVAERGDVAFTERSGDIIWFVLEDGTRGNFNLQTGIYGWPRE